MFLAQTETSTFSLSSYYHVMSLILLCVHIYANVYHCRFIMLDLAFPCVHIYIYYCRCIIAWSCFAVFICHRRYTILDLAVQCVHNVSFMYSKPHLVFHLKFNWVSHLQNRSSVEVLLTNFQQPFLICYWNYIQVEFDKFFNVRIYCTLKVCYLKVKRILKVLRYRNTYW